MTRTASPSRSSSSSRPPSRRVAVLVPLAALGLLVVPVAAAAAAPAAGTTPACTSLTLTGDPSGPPPGRLDAFAVVPTTRPLAPEAFRVDQDGRPLTVAATPVRPAAVAVVLAGASATPAADHDQARLAARELLLDLPAGTRTALVDASGAGAVVAPLSSSTAATDAALAGLLAAHGPSAAARGVLLAANGLPAGGQVVLLDDGTGAVDPAAERAAGDVLRARGVTLHRLTYGTGASLPAPAGPLTGDACTASTAGQSLLSRVDSVARRVASQYRLRVAGVRPGPLTVTARTPDGGDLSAVLDGRVPAAPTVTGTSPAPGAPAATPARRPAPAADAGRRGGLFLAVLLGLVASALGGAAALLLRRRRQRPAAVAATAPAPAVAVAPAAPAVAAAPAAPAPGTAVVAAPRGGGSYRDVDVAIVQESTYPYLKGGVSAVVHDIVSGNQDLTFGIIHITWDRDSPAEDLYGMPANVAWVRPVYLSMAEHREDFTALSPADLHLSSTGRAELSRRIFDALQAVLDGDMDPLWQLYDEGMNPRTRAYPLWAVLGTREFMTATRDRLPALGLPLVATFWLLREFFSLACAVVGGDFPRAAVYHAHTTGYASLLSAAAARQNGTSFLLTEHNLYVRDTVNVMLQRSMALTLKVQDWREFDVPATERAWMAWWIEMGRFCYPSAGAISYLYPKAVVEAADLGAPVEKSVVIPNGMVVREFEEVSRQRERALPAILADDPERVWRLVYIARVVPIKGLADLIETVALLVERGLHNFHLDILGPTDHHPAYYALCREKARSLRVEDYLTFRGTVNVRELLGEFDVLALPSYNEGQPIVVLEAMTAGIPTVGTEVGGMAQLVAEPLTTSGGRTWGACGLLVEPESVVGMADALQTLMRDPAMYADLAANARGRVAGFFQLEDAMGAYNRLYRELGGLEPVELEGSSRPRVIDLTDRAHTARGRQGSHRA